MKFLIVWTPLLVSTLAVAACNRTAPSPSGDQMATLQAATLSAAPAVAPSLTSLPSATPILTPTATPSPMPTAGPSPTPTPPVLSPDDPRYGIDLSKPGYRDGMDSSATWFGPNFDGAVNVWEDGRHHTTDFWTDHMIWWSTTIRDVDGGNFYAEVTAEIEQCTGKDGYGFAFRVNGEARNSGYTLEFSCDASFRFRRFSSGSVEDLTGWRASEAILPGPNAINRLGLLARGSNLYGFANGTYLGEVQDYDFYYGTYGLFANAVETSGVSVTFDDFALWYLSP